MLPLLRWRRPRALAASAHGVKSNLLSFVSRLQVVPRCSISLYAYEIAARNTVSGAVFKEVAMQIVAHNELRARSSPSNVRR
jgi:hypothetical protein